MEQTNLDRKDILINSFLHGNLSHEDTIELVTWIHKSNENRIYFMQLKNLWESTEVLPISSEKALSTVLKQIEKEHYRITFWQFWQRSAAVLLLPLLIATIWLSFGEFFNHSEASSRLTKITAPFGSLANFELPDGSKVWLNAGSSLEYPNKFNIKNRTVKLTGEAYFEVQSNTESPFFVNTSYFNVKATGTRFNIMAYPKEVNHSVSLIEGKVAVTTVNTDGSHEKISNLKPNQHLTYNSQNRKASIETEDTYKHIAWKDGKLVFRNDLLSDVAKKISRQYNIDIEVIGESVMQYRFRASFENEPLNELLRLLKISSPIDYTEVLPKPMSDGTFSKRKIIIYSANK
ncbi:MAG: FecR family protein [Salinivirgaceae bacterium]